MCVVVVVVVVGSSTEIYVRRMACSMETIAHVGFLNLRADDLIQGVDEQSTFSVSITHRVSISSPRLWSSVSLYSVYQGDSKLLEAV